MHTLWFDCMCSWFIDMALCMIPMPIQIDELMKVNPGLKSRFSQVLHFPDFSAEDGAQLLQLTLHKEYALALAQEAEGALHLLVQQVSCTSTVPV